MTDKKKILLVEDDVFILELLADKLIKSGFEVSIAKNGEECMNVVKSLKPDVVLLDILLPKIDGFEILRQMKASQDLSNIPILIISNLGQKEEIQKARDLGANDYIIKANFTTSEIIHKINNILK